MPTYETTYAFAGLPAHRRAVAIERLLKTVEELEAGGVDIEHLGTTVRLDATGRIERAVSQYRAPAERYVGWHGWLAELPVSGIRRLESPTPVELPA